MKKTALNKKTAKPIVCAPPTASGPASAALVFIVLIAIASLIASVLFYFRTTQMAIATSSARGELADASKKIADFQDKLEVYEQGKIAAASVTASCYASPIEGDKNEDARLICENYDGTQRVALSSIRAAFSVDEKSYAPIISAFLADDSWVYVISGVKGNDSVFHVWAYDLSSGTTIDLADR